MPAAVERCVESLLAKWKKDPKSRPKPREEGQTAESQAWAICQAAQKKALEGEIDLISLEGVGPTILGAAVTNRPYIKGLPPMTVDEETGMITVPLLRPGTYSHPKGTLVFNEEVFGRMIANFNGGIVGNDISLDNRHKPELGANGWFKRLFVDSNGILTAEVEGTPQGIDAVKEKRYRYASIEFHRDWESPEMKFSGDDMSEIDLSKIENMEVAEMPDENVTTVSLEQFQELDQARQRLEAELARIQREGEGRIQRLEEAHANTVMQLESQLLRQKVEAVILEAGSYRDESGRGHPKALIDWARAVLLLEDIGEGDEVITLEDRSDAGKVRAYYRMAIVRLLKDLPGSVPFTSAGTEPEKDRPLQFEADTVSDEALTEYVKTDFWEG